MKNPLVESDLIYLEIDVNDPIQIPYRIMRNRVQQVIDEHRIYKCQSEELQKALKQLLSNAPENDVFDLYSSSESESEEWKSAKEFAYQALERTETT